MTLNVTWAEFSRIRRASDDAARFGHFDEVSFRTNLAELLGEEVVKQITGRNPAVVAHRDLTGLPRIAE